MDGLQDLKVLVVDDDPDGCELLAILLAEAAVHVETAGSSHEALRRLEQFCPNIVISDVAMPGQDGYWLLAQLKLKGIPAIALSALSNDECDFALAAGFQAWLSKPVDFDQLLATLRQFQPAKVAH